MAYVVTESLKQNILAASANALKLLNNVNDLRISYKQLHKPHKRATPMNPMKYRVSIQLFKTYNGHIFNSDWLNIGITYEQVPILGTIASCSVGYCKWHHTAAGHLDHLATMAGLLSRLFKIQFCFTGRSCAQEFNAQLLNCFSTNSKVSKHLTTSWAYSQEVVKQSQDRSILLMV